VTDEEEIKLTAKILASKEFRKSFRSSSILGSFSECADPLLLAVWFFSRGYLYCLHEIKELNE
jgi:hypothetical protein